MFEGVSMAVSNGKNLRLFMETIGESKRKSEGQTKSRFIG